MKTFLLALLLLVIQTVHAQFTEATVQVSGLTCAMCSRAVQKSLEKVTFIDEVKPDLKTQAYLIRFKRESAVNFDMIKAAVEDAGFSVASFKATGNFEAVPVRKDSVITVNQQSFQFLNGHDEVLTGLKTITVVEKDFLTPKAYKKFSADFNLKGAVAKRSDVTSRTYQVIL